MGLTSSHYPVSDSQKEKFDPSKKQLQELRSVTNYGPLLGKTQHMQRRGEEPGVRV